MTDIERLILANQHAIMDAFAMINGRHGFTPEMERLQRRIDETRRALERDGRVRLLAESGATSAYSEDTRPGR